MHTTKIKNAIRLGLVMVLATLTCTGTALAADPVGDSAIGLGVHASNPVTTIRSAQIKRLMSGRTVKWKDGTPIVLVLPAKHSPEMLWLCSEILGIPEEVYRRFILEKIFRGEMRPPIDVATHAEGLRVLASTPGGIGPISAEGVTPGVKLITIE